MTDAIPYTASGISVSAWRICAVAFKDKIYIGTSSGLEVFDTDRKSFLTEPKIDSDLTVQGLSSDVRSLAISPSGVLAISLFGSGIYFYDLVKQKTIAFEKKNLQNTNAGFWPLCSEFINDTLFYCGTQNSLIKINVANYRSVQHTGTAVSIIENAVTAIAATQKKSVLLAGSHLIETGGTANYSDTIASVASEADAWLKNITTVFTDMQQNIWVGSLKGLAMIKPGAPLFTPVKNSIAAFSGKMAHVFAVCATENNKVLFGTQEGLYLNNNSVLKQLYSGGRVQNIVRISASQILVSGYSGILFFENGILKQPEQLYPELKPFKKWQFNSFIKISDSICLLGTESNKGVLEWNIAEKKITQLNTAANGQLKLPSDIINSMLLTSDKNVLILSDYFITIYSAGKGVIKIINSADLGVKGIFMQAEQAGNEYWIAAYSNGLLRLNNRFEVMKIYTPEQGLTNAGVYRIFNYNDSVLFVTTNFGMAVFKINKELFFNYYEEDGLQGNLFEEASGDVFNAAFYAGGSGGYVKILPANLSFNTLPPVLHFTNFLSESSSGILTDTFDLNMQRTEVQSMAVQAKVYFVAVNYNNPLRVTYQYRIKELGDSWINIGQQNYISLIGTSPGTYHLQVKAANEDGVWSEPKELILIFLPKWYQTWWFYAAIVLLTAGILYALYRYRINQIKKQHQIRKNIATDLHDDLGSTLNSVKVFTNLAISGVKQEESLQQVKDNLTEATMSLRDMIWVLDDSLDTVDELVTRLKQFAIPITAASNMEFVITAGSDVNSRTLTKEEKRNLFLICKEAINNSIKYSGATQIKVDITPAAKKIQITVADNGKGFDEATVKKGYGLKNMQYRAGQVRYKITLATSPGNGAQIFILSS